MATSSANAGFSGVSNYALDLQSVISRRVIHCGDGRAPRGLADAASAVTGSHHSVETTEFRYPEYQGVETTSLVIPEGVQVQFNTTSLDVIHSFWAYELGVKADAVPGANNIAFAVANKTGNFQIRCAELCGPLHGAMSSTGRVVSPTDFDAWMSGELSLHAEDIPLLPPYATIYLPQVDGGLYDPGQDPLPPDPTLPSPAP